MVHVQGILIVIHMWRIGVMMVQIKLFYAERWRKLYRSRMFLDVHLQVAVRGLHHKSVAMVKQTLLGAASPPASIA